MDKKEIYKFFKVISGCLFTILEIMREYRRIKRLYEEKSDEKETSKIEKKSNKTND